MTFRNTLVAALALTAALAVPTGALARAEHHAREARCHQGRASPTARSASRTRSGSTAAWSTSTATRAGSSSTCRPPGPSPDRAHPSCSCSTAAAAPVSSSCGSRAGASRPTRTGLVAVFPTGLRYRVLDSGRLSTKWNDYSPRITGRPERAPTRIPRERTMARERRRLRRRDDVRPRRAAADRPPPRLRVRLLQRRWLHRAAGRGALDRARGGRVLRWRAARRAGTSAADPDVPDRRNAGRSRPGADRAAAADPAAARPAGAAGRAGDQVDDHGARRHARARRGRLRRDQRPAVHVLSLARHRHRRGGRGDALRGARWARAQVPQRAQQPRRLRGRPRVLGLLPDPPPAGRRRDRLHAAARAAPISRRRSGRTRAPDRPRHQDRPAPAPRGGTRAPTSSAVGAA